MSTIVVDETSGPSFSSRPRHNSPEDIYNYNESVELTVLLTRENVSVIMTTPLTSDVEGVTQRHSDSSSSSSQIQRNRWRQHLAAILATLAAMSAGCVLGWTSPALPILEHITAERNYTVTGEDASWLGSLVAVGALVGALPAGVLADILGRRLLLLLLGLPFIVGWTLIGGALNYADQPQLLYIGRFILGVAVGAVTVVVPLYNSEIAEDAVRGALGAYLQFMITLGILWVYLFGAFVSFDCCLPFVCMILPIVFVLTFRWMPESPMYLLKIGRTDAAAKSLCWLRDTDNTGDIEKEMLEIQNSFVTTSSNQQLIIRSTTAKSLAVVLGLMAFQQLGGINAVIFYASSIFRRSDSVLTPATATIIVGIVQVLATYASSLLVDRVGRRILLLFSEMGMMTCLLSLAFGFLPLLSVALYIVLFSVGLGPLPWLLMAELVPIEVAGWASAAAVCLNWGLVFLVTNGFPRLFLTVGPSATFGLFSTICTIGFIFVYVTVPETKGKSYFQIQSELRRK